MMFIVPWKKEEEEYGTWRRRHNRICDEQLAQAAAEDLPTAMLRRQYRWVTGAHNRFARVLLRQTSRRVWPTLEVWSNILSSMRQLQLSSASRVWHSTACAPVCFLVYNDEESWRLKQAIFSRIDPHNSQHWRHSRPGRQVRWETVMLRLAGERWKENVLAGELRGCEDQYVNTAFEQVGRSLRRPLHPAALSADRADDHRTGTAPARPAAQGAQIPEPTWASAFEDLGDVTQMRIEFGSDCAALVNWVNGVWTLFNARYREPLTRCMHLVSNLRSLGCRPRSRAHDWFAHYPRKQNQEADALARVAGEFCEVRQEFPWPRKLQVRSDGGCSEREGASCGWALWGCGADLSDESEASWVCLAVASWRLPPHFLPIEAEFAGMICAMNFVYTAVREDAFARPSQASGASHCRDIGASTERICAAGRPQVWPRSAWRWPSQTQGSTEQEKRRGGPGRDERRVMARSE